MDDRQIGSPFLVYLAWKAKPSLRNQPGNLSLPGLYRAREAGLMIEVTPKPSFELLLVNDLIENIPIGVMILDRQGKILRTNSKQEQISQIPRAKVEGRLFHEAFPKTLEQGLARPYWLLLKRHKPFDVTIDRYIPQYYNRLMTYRARSAYLPTIGSFVLLHDLEEELYYVKRIIERRTRELDSSKTFLESLINSSPNIVIGTDLRNRITIFNDTAEQAFRYSKSDVIRRSIRNLVTLPKTLLDGHQPIHRQWEATCFRKDRTIFPASVSFSHIINSNGKRIGQLYILSDLTEKKAMEERLSISEKLAVYSELMGGIAHQINNPMIGVVNFSEMLIGQFEPGDPRGDIARSIYKAGRECLQIIGSVLGCLKDPRLTFSKLSVNDLLQSVLNYLMEDESERFSRVELSLDLSRDLPEVMGDSLQLKQCFLNILRNAIEVMEGSTRKLGIITTYDAQTQLVSIAIKDTGPGIPRENLERIFLPFYSWPRRQGHHGLGLSFAYQIIRNHGGRIDVQSQLGVGTSFVVALPTQGG